MNYLDLLRRSINKCNALEKDKRAIEQEKNSKIKEKKQKETAIEQCEEEIADLEIDNEILAKAPEFKKSILKTTLKVGGAIQLFFISIGGIFTIINNHFIDTNLNITLFQFLGSTLGMGLITNVLGLPNAYFYDTKYLRDLKNKYKDISLDQEINAKKAQIEILKSELAALETSIDHLEVEEKRKELLIFSLRNLITHIMECYEDILMSDRVEDAINIELASSPAIRNLTNKMRG